MKRTLYTLSIAALSGLFGLGLMAFPVEAANLQDWGKLRSNADRFTVLSQTKEAVRDNETQLIWELAPGDTNEDVPR